MSVHYFEGIGRRKEAVARVRLMAGTGRFIVNDKEGPVYFGRLGDMETMMLPFKAAGQDAHTYDVTVLVKGGGVTGQTDAITLGLARAFVKMDATLTPAMRKFGLMTRDARIKERKKPGLKRARKAPTYTKR